MKFKYDLTQLKSKEHLMRFLGVDEAIFEIVLAFDPNKPSPDEFSSDETSLLDIPPFVQHRIPKKNPKRGYRTVWEPLLIKNDYKALARRLHDYFKHTIPQYPHPRSFGYVGGRNIKENARDHCGHQLLITIDLEDFFPSISGARIENLLVETGISPTVANWLSLFVTIGGMLPLGLPTSPTIANAVSTPMDIELATLAQKYRATFSRYADDLSFSGDGTLPSLAELANCVQKHQFKIASSKTRKSKLGQAHYVTGLSISDTSQPHVPRKKKRRLRQELFYAQKYGLDSHLDHLGINDERLVQEEVNRLDGLVKFTAFHEPRASARLKNGWAKILHASGHRPSFKPKNLGAAPFSIFVDEAEYARPDDTPVLAIAMAVSQHQDQVNKAVQEVLDATLSDLWAAGNRSALEKNGMHFSHATQDMRLTFVDRMRTLPFEGYVAMAKLSSASEYERTYLRLLGALIKRRLMAAESRLALLVFERNDKVRRKSIRKLVMDAHARLRETNNRRPEICCVDFVGKPNLGMSVPDFLLGVLGKYLTRKPAVEHHPTPRDVLLFERIRDKYRLILDVDKSIEYSRRRPIEPW